MTSKLSSKGKFPLQLNSVVDKQEKHRPKNVTATPQTAMRNAALQSQARLTPLPHQLPLRDTNERLKAATNKVSTIAPTEVLVSDNIRAAMVARVAQKGVKDALVLEALRAIPRHLFIESGLSSQAYIDASLPIGYHQTISQPYIVARMIEIMRNGAPMQRILEIGTGCGYQAAVLSLVAKEVYSIERIKGLHELAKVNLRPMRIANIRLHYGDGMDGLPQVAPFDGIILAAAGLEIPQQLLEQLAIGGRLIGPVGGRQQSLQLIQRVSKSEWTKASLESCHFVPLHAGVI
jgi:protein-L-isoaspartate(D-aspartate) O-methyltransferase